ncbi:hypothetical protein RRG08_028033 [Elysia crispata]|uniref:Uncharacterized protein n=1 Tax=Elysia crispata TaxID=231223 RepID=A0AAE1EEQ0_9GAST|nr:hypothetical protein RRG08_028033 [Elysia crispata]
MQSSRLIVYREFIRDFVDSIAVSINGHFKRTNSSQLWELEVARFYFASGGNVSIFIAFERNQDNPTLDLWMSMAIEGRANQGKLSRKSCLI